MTAEKKRDTMLSGAGSNTGVSPGTANGYDMASGNQRYCFYWTATGRNRTGVVNSATRNATTVFMKGLKENLTLETNNGQAWRWRRICFTMKRGPNSLVNWSAANGVIRTIVPINLSSLAADITLWTSLKDYVFRGAEGSDWRDLLIAPTDNIRVDIKYDKTRVIKSGNSNGTQINPRMWHGMNKNLTYDDDESGAVTASQPYSVPDKRGMGDYHILDMFDSVGLATDGVLTFDVNSTLYWHEK